MPHYFLRQPGLLEHGELGQSRQMAQLSLLDVMHLGVGRGKTLGQASGKRQWLIPIRYPPKEAGQGSLSEWGNRVSF